VNVCRGPAEGRRAADLDVIWEDTPMSSIDQQATLRTTAGSPARVANSG
jgi:hypothetical protein